MAAPVTEATPGNSDGIEKKKKSSTKVKKRNTVAGDVNLQKTSTLPTAAHQQVMDKQQTSATKGEVVDEQSIPLRKSKTKNTRPQTLPRPPKATKEELMSTPYPEIPTESSSKRNSTPVTPTSVNGAQSAVQTPIGSDSKSRNSSASVESADTTSGGNRSLPLRSATPVRSGPSTPLDATTPSSPFSAVVSTFMSTPIDDGSYHPSIRTKPRLSPEVTSVNNNSTNATPAANVTAGVPSALKSTSSLRTPQRPNTTIGVPVSESMRVQPTGKRMTVDGTISSSRPLNESQRRSPVASTTPTATSPTGPPQQQQQQQQQALGKMALAGIIQETGV